MERMTPFGLMTDEEKKDLLLADYDNQPIQVYCNETWESKPIGEPFYAFRVYRLKKEPKYRLHIGRVEGYRVEFQTKDGVPMPETVSIEAF